jgi:hypothetical protein
MQLIIPEAYGGFLSLLVEIPGENSLKRLSHEIDFENVDEN